MYDLIGQFRYGISNLEWAFWAIADYTLKKFIEMIMIILMRIWFNRYRCIYILYKNIVHIFKISYTILTSETPEQNYACTYLPGREKLTETVSSEGTWICTSLCAGTIKCVTMSIFTVIWTFTNASGRVPLRITTWE